MKNKLILSSVALVCAAQAFAYVEKSEVMTIEKADGTTVQYTISDLDRVSFSTVETQYALFMEKADGEQVKLQSFPKVFFAQPAVDGDPYNYGFSFVEAATPEEARQGDYAVQVSVSALKMNETVDLTGGATSGVTVSLYSYADGEVAKVWDAQTEGSFSMSTNAKNGQVTMNIVATFEDGTTVDLTYKGKPTATDDLTALNPPFEYKNQGEYFNQDGNSSGAFSIESASHSTKKYHGVTFEYFEFELSNYQTLKIYVLPELVNTVINFPDAQADQFIIEYGYSFTLASLGTLYSNQAMVGTLSVQKTDDGKYIVDLDCLNRYLPYNSTTISGSEKERIVFNYNEANL